MSVPRLVPPFVAACLMFWAPLQTAVASPEASGPEAQACEGRSVGDACTLPNRQLGVCGQGTCSELDYSGGSPPKAVEKPCVVCEAKGATPHEGPPALGSGGPPAEESPADEGGAESPPSSNEGGSTAGSSKSEAGTVPPESSSRCSVAREDGPSGLALFAIVALLRGRPRRENRVSRVSPRSQPGSAGV